MADHGIIAICYRVLQRLMRSLTSRGAVLGALGVLLLALAVGSYRVWLKYADQILSLPQYTLAVDHLEITPQPQWIKSDVRQQVFRDGSLDGLRITKRGLTAQVKDAFVMNPWVDQVVKVSKHYGPRIIVELKYRQPVAMVEVQQDNLTKMLPVDAKGHVLPGAEEFRREDTLRYLWIRVDNAWPASDSTGTVWGDKRIHGAARIANVLLDHWEPLNLSLISSDGDGEKPSYVLHTRGGRQIPWGHAPGEEVFPELKADGKLQRLLSHGPIDQLPINELPDLCVKEQAAVARRGEGL